MIANAEIFKFSASLAASLQTPPQAAKRFVAFMPASGAWLGPNNHWVMDVKHALRFGDAGSAQAASAGYETLIQVQS